MEETMFHSFVVCLFLAAADPSPSTGVVSSNREVENPDRRHTSFALQPLSLLSETATAGVEHALSDKLSFIFWATVTVRHQSQHSQSDLVTNDADTIAGGIEPGLNYFFTGTALQGFWIGPRLTFDYIHFTTHGRNTSVEGSSFTQSHSTIERRIGGSLLIGYNAIFGAGFTAQVGVGGGATYTWADLRDDSSPPIVGYSPPVSADQLGVGLRGVFALGWSI